MKKLIFLLFFVGLYASAQDQVAPKYDLTRPNPKTTAEILSMTRMQEGSEAWNTDTNTMWRYVLGGWVDTGAGGGGGASQLSDLTDVGTTTPTNRNVLIADGTSFQSRPLVEADVSNLSHTVDTDDQNLSEVLAQGNDAGGLKIVNLADPTLAQDAATKAYVDANAGSVTLDAVPTNGSTNGVESNGVFDALAAKVSIDPNSPLIPSLALANTQAELIAANLSPNTVGFSGDGGSTLSLNSLTDVTKGSPAANSSGTLRVLADPNNDGNYNEVDWTPPGGSGGLATTDIDTSAEIATIVTDETGSGSLVLSNSPSLVTPSLGTPSSLVLTNATGLTSAGIVDGTITEADANISINASLDLADSSTQPGDNLSTLTNDLNFIRQDSDSPISGFRFSAGSTAALAAQPAPSGFYRVNIDTTSSSAAGTDYFLTGLNLGLSGSDLTLTATRNGTTDVVSNTIALPTGSTDANTLDTLDSTQFLRSDANDEATGDIVLSGAVSVKDGVNTGSGTTSKINFIDSADSNIATVGFITPGVAGIRNNIGLHGITFSSSSTVLPGLTGTGTQMITVTPGGVLGRQAIPTSGVTQSTGTWTPVLEAGGTTPYTYTAQGYYVKTGDVVHLWAYFTNIDGTAASGNLQVTGLPFNANVASFTSEQQMFPYAIYGTSSAAITAPTIGTVSSNTLNLRVQDGATNAANAGVDFSGSGTIIINMTYIAQ